MVCLDLVRARSHDSLTAWSAPRPSHFAASPRAQTHTSHRRQYRALDCGYEGEWAAVKHGGRGIRGWKTLHLGVDGSGLIVAHALTGGHVDDATKALTI